MRSKQWSVLMCNQTLESKMGSSPKMLVLYHAPSDNRAYLACRSPSSASIKPGKEMPASFVEIIPLGTLSNLPHDFHGSRTNQKEERGMPLSTLHSNDLSPQQLCPSHSLGAWRCGAMRWVWFCCCFLVK